MENPEFYEGGYYNSQFTHEKRVPVVEAKNADNFIDDLLNLPNDDGMVVAADGILDNTVTTTDSSSTANTVVDTSCNSSSFSAATTDTHEPHYSNFPGEDYIGCGNLSSSDPQFSSELCVPYDDLAELEWLSNFVEDSFSTEDLQKLQLISGIKTSPNNNEPSPETHHNDDEFHLSEPNHHRGGGGATAVTHYHHPMMFRPETAVPAKARSKRSRAAPCNWTSRLLVVSPSPALPTATAATTTTTTTSTMSSSSDQSDIATSSVGGGGGIGGKKSAAKSNPKKKDGWENTSMAINGGGGGGEGRKCLHCATDKTPQWRTGPMGPKTLCNACGVRYKSGRLVPEYRPAASPTFVLTKHSNSHRKVLELRRQKEMIRAQTQQQQQQQFLHQSMMFDVSNGDDYLIHQHIGPDFRQLI